MVDLQQSVFASFHSAQHYSVRSVILERLNVLTQGKNFCELETPFLVTLGLISLISPKKCYMKANSFEEPIRCLDVWRYFYKNARSFLTLQYIAMHCMCGQLPNSSELCNLHHQLPWHTRKVHQPTSSPLPPISPSPTSPLSTPRTTNRINTS